MSQILDLKLYFVLLENTTFYDPFPDRRCLRVFRTPITQITQNKWKIAWTLQSKCLRVIGNYPRRTPIPLLHSTLHIEPIHEFIYRLSEKFFHHCSTHQNPLVRQIGDYTMSDLQQQYKIYIHKRTVLNIFYCNSTKWPQCFLYIV